MRFSYYKFKSINNVVIFYKFMIVTIKSILNVMCNNIGKIDIKFLVVMVARKKLSLPLSDFLPETMNVFVYAKFCAWACADCTQQNFCYLSLQRIFLKSKIYRTIYYRYHSIMWPSMFCKIVNKFHFILHVFVYVQLLCK